MQAQPHWKPSKPVGWHTYDIWKNHGGISGFYRGVHAAMVRAAVVNAAYLGSYDTVKHFIINKQILEDGIQSQVLSAAITGFIISAVSSPIDNIKIQLMTSSKGADNGILDCAKKMLQQGGYKAFYRGFLPQCLNMSPFVMIQLLTYETLRRLSGFEGM